MSRSTLLRFAAISWLPLFSLVASAQAQNNYNAATDWKSTFATSAAAVAASAPTWGAGNAWSAGVLSWNWTNQQAVVGNSSLQTLQTYYNTNTTGYLSSGTKLTAATYTYTVPFQSYQLEWPHVPAADRPDLHRADCLGPEAGKERWIRQ